MKTSYLSIGIAFGFLVAAACGPSQPANTSDDSGGTTAPTTTAAPVDTAAGTDPGGAPNQGDPGTGGAADPGTAGGATDPATGTGGAAAGPATPQQLVATGDAVNGKTLYETNNCNGCHGSKEKPNAKFPNLYKISWDDKQIDKAFNIVKKGKAPMPAYGDKLDDKKIADIVAFLKTSVGR